MPVAVVALAAGSFAAGATAFAAATTLAATVAAGAMMVGSALTIVGTVTGNAKLTKIGAIVGIAGSLGNLAVNAMSAGEAAAGSAAAGAEVGTSAATDAAAGASSASAGNAGVAVGDAVQTLPVSAPGGIDAMADGLGKGAIDTMSTTGPASAAAPISATASAAATPSTASSMPGMLDSATSIDAYKPADIVGPDAFNSAAQVNTPFAVTAGPADPSMLAKAQAWAKENPELAKMALNGAGTAFSGLVPSEKDKALMAAYQAQATSNKAQTDALNRKALWGSGRTA